MSIRSIDTQIMITRTADMAREAGSVQKQPEVAQSHIATQTKTESAQNQSRVASTNESEMENVRTDVDGEGSGAAGGEGSAREGENPEEEVPLGLRVAPAQHDQLIDIVI